MTVTTKLYFVRHGQTDWNSEKRTQGIIDVPLNSNGREMAEKVGKRLRNVSFDVAYSSPLRRAEETAQIILRHQEKCPELITDKRLIETRFGKWEGLTIEEIGRLYPREWSDYRNDPHNFCAPEGESLDCLIERAAEASKEIVSSWPEARILVVSHGAFLRTLFCQLLGIDYRRQGSIRLDNTGISVFGFHEDRSPQLMLLNDIGEIR